MSSDDRKEIFPKELPFNVFISEFYNEVNPNSPIQKYNIPADDEISLARGPYE